MDSVMSADIVEVAIPMSPEEMQMVQEAMDEKIEAWAITMLKKRSEAIEYRANSGVERRWRISERVYGYSIDEDKISMMDYASGQAPVRGRGPKRSRVSMNIVRSRCETAEGRFADVMLPVGERNWGLKTTPNPTMDAMAKDQRPAMQMGQPVKRSDGQQATISDVASDITAIANKAMEAMEREIEDQFVECDFNGECRKMIGNAIRLGTGILKGPSVIKTVKRSWKPQTSEGVTVHILDQCEDLTPSSKSVSPWDVYPSPDCGEDIRDASCIWERNDTVRPRDIANLMKLPPSAGYNKRLLQMVLDEDPLKTSCTYSKNDNKQSARTDKATRGGLYEQWEYYGDVSKEDLDMLGCGGVEGQTASACIVFINDRPVKAELNTLDTGELPFDFFQWSVVADEPWGIGIPYIMLWSQRIIDAAWRAMMDNAGDSAGVNLVIGPGVEPDDGKWEITGKKIWRPDGSIDLEDVRKSFAQFQIANNQDQFQKIIELTLRFVDLETAMPTIFQGEAREIPETLGATNIMVDAANTAFRSRVKKYDDQITRRHLRRYYDWNMQYNEDSTIKGDFNVDPRGVSVLYEKDQQAQLLLQVFQLKSDPDINRMVDWEKAIKQFFATRRLNIIKDDKQIEDSQQQQMQQQPPQNPALEIAQVRTQGELQKAQMVQQADMSELQFKAQQAELDRQHQSEMKQMDVKIKMMEFASKENISLAELKAQLALSSAGMNLQKELADNKNEKGSSVPQIITPPTEPAGRAPIGEAYQR